MRLPEDVLSISVVNVTTHMVRTHWPNGGEFNRPVGDDGDGVYQVVISLRSGYDIILNEVNSDANLNGIQVGIGQKQPNGYILDILNQGK